MLTKFYTVFAPTAVDVDNWIFFLGLLVYIVLLLLAAFVLLEGVESLFTRKRVIVPDPDLRRRQELNAASRYAAIRASVEAARRDR